MSDRGFKAKGRIELIMTYDDLRYPSDIQKPNKFLYEHNRQTQILLFKVLRKPRTMQRRIKSY